MEKDVAIIGGGIIGLCCAYYLSKSGNNSIVVFEKGSIADEASYNNMGGLWPNIMSRPDVTKPFADLSLSLYEEMATKEGFQFEFRRNGVLEVMQGNSNIEEVERQVQERRSRGYDIRFVGSDEIKMMEPNLSKNFVGGIFCPHDANASSYALAKELYIYLTERGVSILENAEALDFQAESDKIVEVRTSKGFFSAKHIVNAAGPWSPFIGNLLGISIPVLPAKGYMLETNRIEELLNAAVTNNNIVVTQRPGGQVRVGGIVEFAGFDRTFDKRKQKMIWDDACSILPSLKEFSPAEARTAFRPHSPDMLPIIGYSKEIKNLILATGHFRRGFELASATGKAVSELINYGKSSIDIGFAATQRFDL